MLIAMHYSGHTLNGSSARLLGQVWASPTLVSSIAYIYGVHCSVCEWLRSACNNGKWQTPNKCERRWPWKMMLMNDSQEGQPGRTAGACIPLYEGNICVLVTTFSLGSWSVAFTHWMVYRARAINIQLCRKAQFTERIEGGRDSVPCWCMMTSFAIP